MNKDDIKLLKSIANVNLDGGPQYEVVIPADQTIVMWAGVNAVCAHSPWTVDHKLAKLFNSEEEALDEVQEHWDADDLEVNKVENEQEYRSREDTW